MDYASKMQFLAQVRAMVASRQVSIAELVDAGTHALEQRFDKVNDMRVEAECALSMVVDLIPVSKHVKHETAMVRAKKVLVNSGMFAGTEYTERLQQEIEAKGNNEK